jgi:2-dehydro-3-deoxyphosphogluconate aldolase / (4S)-4-hydroxy-2-oxoglutarate aldolase
MLYLTIRKRKGKNMSTIHQKVRNIGIVPVIKLDSTDYAIPLGQALIAGGLPVAEITFRTSAGEESIRIMRKEFPDMLVGAGTITNVDSARRAIEAGAQFVVSPGYSEDVVAYCIEKGVTVYPGVNNPSQIQQALNQGLQIVKFFPAEASGGIEMLDALSAPFPSIKFMPTGGIGMGNIGSYIKKPYIVACGGSWMVKAELMSQGKWDEITRLSREAVNAVHGFSFAHVGISEDSVDACTSTANAFGSMLQPVLEGNSSVFVSDFIEVTKTTSRGTKGHIGIRTWDVERATAYLAHFGFKLVPETIKKDAKGMITVAYLDKEIGGFAVHLVRAK